VVTMKSSVVWDVMPCANVPSSLILIILMMEALCSSKTSVLERAKWHNILEDGILCTILFARYN
jgi:hypothetical protein